METVEIRAALYSWECPNCETLQDTDVNSHEFENGQVECEHCHREFKFEIDK